MVKISVSIIGCNEARNLPGCLASVKWADELVFVDCESSDDSLAIASAAGARVFSRPNNPNLNVNKQFGLEQCSGEWILYLDPDEAVSPALAAEMRDAALSQARAAYFVPRRNYYFGRWLRHGGKYPDKQLRFFRAGKASFPCVDVHERLKVDGAVGELKEALDHHPYSNSGELLRKLAFYAGRKVERDSSGRKPVSLGRAGRRFLYNYLLRLGFLDGGAGLVSAVTDLFSECLAWLKAGENGKA